MEYMFIAVATTQATQGGDGGTLRCYTYLFTYYRCRSIYI